MNFSLLGFYIIMTAFGTFFIYNFGLKSDWQKLRIDNGLCTVGSMLSPDRKTKTIDGENIFSGICYRLLFFSSIVAITINIGHYLFNDSVNVQTTRNILTNGVSIFCLYGMFAGVPLKTDNVDSNIYQPVIKALSHIKKQILHTAIVREQDHYHNYIQDTFKRWLDERKDNEKLLTFIAAINDKFFHQLFGDVLDEERSVRVRLFAQDIGESYANNNILLHEHLNVVFGKHLIGIGAQLFLVVQLLANHNEKVFTEEEIRTAKESLEKEIEAISNSQEHYVEDFDNLFDNLPW